jgi:uncharacterized membrane protein
LIEPKKKKPSRAEIIITKIVKILAIIWLVAIIALFLFGKLAEALLLIFPALIFIAFIDPKEVNDYLFLIWWDKSKK